jgi:hypothetical protein
MADDKTKRRPQDASRINIHEPYEVNYWCDALNVTKAQLVEAVGRVGVMVKDVKAYLGR